MSLVHYGVNIDKGSRRQRVIIIVAHHAVQDAPSNRLAEFGGREQQANDVRVRRLLTRRINASLLNDQGNRIRLSLHNPLYQFLDREFSDFRIKVAAIDGGGDRPGTDPDRAVR